MKYSEEFKTYVYEVIEEIEKNSVVEIVTMIKPKSDNYRDISFATGAILLFISYTYFMFAPTIFNVYWIYFMTLSLFIFGFLMVEVVRPLKRLFARSKRLNKQVELNARAIFQKGGLHHTSKKAGILVYMSLFEKKSFIIADKGAKKALPSEVWKSIEENFQNAFKAPDFNASLIQNLKNCKDIFSKYLPATENDINELPDNLDVDI